MGQYRILRCKNDVTEGMYVIEAPSLYDALHIAADTYLRLGYDLYLMTPADAGEDGDNGAEGVASVWWRRWCDSGYESDIFERYYHECWERILMFRPENIHHCLPVFAWLTACAVWKE